MPGGLPAVSWLVRGVIYRCRGRCWRCRRVSFRFSVPACGKSYFLASMTWRLRNVLPRYFGLALADADPLMNHRLHEYESQQF